MKENRQAPTLDYAKREAPLPLLSRIQLGTIGLTLSLLTIFSMLAFVFVAQPVFGISQHNVGNPLITWLYVPALLAIVNSFLGIAQNPKSGVPYFGIVLAIAFMILAPAFMCA